MKNLRRMSDRKIGNGEHIPFFKMAEIPTTIKNRKLVQRRREQIALAAIKVFSEKGFHKATLRDLSKEAGMDGRN